MSMCKCEKCGKWVPTCCKYISGCEFCVTEDRERIKINESTDKGDYISGKA